MVKIDRERYGTQFDYPVSLAGTTGDGRVSVWYEPGLGAPGLKVADDVLSGLDALMTTNDYTFGVAAPAGGNVLIVNLNGRGDGSAGAYHYGCDFITGGDWYEDVALGNSLLTFGLVQSEISESYMGLQALGWNCGSSNGEALSRVMAEQVSGGAAGALKDYTTGPSWLGAGRPDYLSITDTTDQSAASTGCGVLYLWWMISLGHTMSEIVQAGCPGGTLAGNYKAVTGKVTAWPDFLAAVKALRVAIGNDNPWEESPPPPPPPQGTALHPGTYILGKGTYTFTV